MDKRYLALLAGTLPEARTAVDAPLIKNTLQQRGAGGAGGRGGGQAGAHPVSAPAPVRRALTLVEVRLLTGRTHQIRVHAAHLGAPVAGDEKYGDSEANRRLRDLGLKRLFLHAGDPDLPRRLHGGAPAGRVAAARGPGGRSLKALELESCPSS